jgi:hypothetical protein
MPSNNTAMLESSMDGQKWQRRQQQQQQQKRTMDHSVLMSIQ